MLRALSHPITLVVFTILSIIFFLSLEKTGNKREQSAQIISVLEDEKAALSREVALLERETLAASSSINTERLVRNELLVQKEGEYVVQIPDIEIVSEQLENVEPTPEPWQQWKDLLF